MKPGRWLAGGSGGGGGPQAAAAPRPRPPQLQRAKCARNLEGCPSCPSALQEEPCRRSRSASRQGPAPSCCVRGRQGGDRSGALASAGRPARGPVVGHSGLPVQRRGRRQGAALLQQGSAATSGWRGWPGAVRCAGMPLHRGTRRPLCRPGHPPAANSGPPARPPTPPGRRAGQAWRVDGRSEQAAALPPTRTPLMMLQAPSVV